MAEKRQDHRGVARQEEGPFNRLWIAEDNTLAINTVFESENEENLADDEWQQCLTNLTDEQYVKIDYEELRKCLSYLENGVPIDAENQLGAPEKIEDFVSDPSKCREASSKFEDGSSSTGNHDKLPEQQGSRKGVATATEMGPDTQLTCPVIEGLLLKRRLASTQQVHVFDYMGLSSQNPKQSLGIVRVSISPAEEETSLKLNCLSLKQHLDIPENEDENAISQSGAHEKIQDFVHDPSNCKEASSKLEDDPNSTKNLEKLLEQQGSSEGVGTGAEMVPDTHLTSSAIEGPSLQRYLELMQQKHASHYMGPSRKNSEPSLDSVHASFPAAEKPSLKSKHPTLMRILSAPNQEEPSSKKPKLSAISGDPELGFMPIPLSFCDE